MPQVLSFVLFSFLCHVTSTQRMSLELNLSTLAHPWREVLVRGEAGGPKTCFTGRSSSYSDTYVVNGGRKLSNTTEYSISTHCRLAPNMITPHSSPAAAAGLGFTALQNCVHQYPF
ncbi:hypothetical protein EV421DRAFT_597195 [Armillaria borealis]|uniref:Secreted protein n=1 Tax=Armillaria borealis TaxID=47425 RepID=A0AA39JG42_9AGAR|nr:hypothetical protein EV421DRAFT_597195 [Armillaria borealis]